MMGLLPRDGITGLRPMLVLMTVDIHELRVSYVRLFTCKVIKATT